MSIREQVINKLNKAFQPVHLEVVNESDKHSVPKGSESHFKVLIVSEVFRGLARIDRQRKVNKVLANELGINGGGAGQIHALAQRALTPDEWQADSQFESPECKGGAKVR